MASSFRSKAPDKEKRDDSERGKSNKNYEKRG